jgi:hypothetical protein
MAPSASPRKKATSGTPASQEKKKPAASKEAPGGTGADIRNFVCPSFGLLPRLGHGGKILTLNQFSQGSQGVSLVSLENEVVLMIGTLETFSSSSESGDW